MDIKAGKSGLSIDWKQYPLVRMAPALLGGMAAGLELDGIAVTALAALALGLVFLSTRKARSAPCQACHALLFLAGLAVAPPARPVIAQGELACEGIAVIAGLPEEKPKSVKAVLSLTDSSGHSQKVLAYFQKDGGSQALQPGDRIYLRNKFRPVPPPALPGSFDYAQFLARQGIGHSGYVRGDRWELLPGMDPRWCVMRTAGAFRQELSVKIGRNVPDPGAGLVRAMFLGERSAVDVSMRDSFARTGIVHILAVSGLHVGIIFLLASLAHRPFTATFPALRPAGILLEAAAVWAFAFLTGLGPSVQRAAFMFTLFSLARLSHRDTAALNITAGSAILLLLIQPGLLYRAGFQLSYAAVAGILIVYPAVYPLWTPRNKLVNKFWQTEVVSLAAVAGTAPISIVYFQQFPLVFPVANLFALPAAFLLVAGTLVMFLLSPFPPAAVFIGQYLARLADWLSKATDFLAALPLSHLNGVHIGAWESAGLYAAIGGATALAATRGRNFAALAVLLLGLAVVCQASALIKWKKYREPDAYVMPAKAGLHYQVGRRQYRILVDGPETREDMAGHRKYGRIKDEEVFVTNGALLDSLARSLSLPAR